MDAFVFTSKKVIEHLLSGNASYKGYKIKKIFPCPQEIQSVVRIDSSAVKTQEGFDWDRGEFIDYFGDS